MMTVETAFKPIVTRGLRIAILLAVLLVVNTVVGDETDQVTQASADSGSAAAIEAYAQRLRRPDVVVTSKSLVELAIMSANARIPIDYRSFGKDVRSREKLKRLSNKKRDLNQKLLDEYTEAAWLNAPTKQPVIQARTLLQLFRLTYGIRPFEKRPVPRERLELVRNSVVAVFEQLPPDVQILFLESLWRQLGGRELLPALRKFIEVAPERDIADGNPVPIDWALLRIHELDPKEGRRLIVAEMQRATPRATVLSLARLPNRSIPKLDAVLASRLEESLGGPGRHDGELAAALVGRYGSSAIYDRVRKVYGNDGGSWACDAQASMLAYFVRHDPKQGSLLINQALDSRKQTGCFRNVLTDVASKFKSPVLEGIAIRRLQDSSLNVATDAISILKQHGSSASEAALWRRFQNWHDDWMARADELAAATDGSPEQAQIRLEGSLVFALASGNNWITPPRKLARLRELCVTDRNRMRVTGMIEKWQDLAIQFHSGANGEFDSARIPRRTGWSRYSRINNDAWFVAQYRAGSVSELKHLLSRLPKGSTLSFPNGMLSDAKVEQRLFDALSAHATRHGLTLRRSISD